MLKVVKDILMLKLECASEIRGFQDDFRWLSNFFPIEPFEYDGITFNTTENFYQAMKSLDRKEREYIAKLKPGESKRYVNPIYNKKFIVREDWDDIKLSVMEYGLRQKFSQPDFKDLLLSTRNIYIEETNGWGDVFWGCNTSGEGQNILGKIITKLRAELLENKNLLDYKPEKISNYLKKKNPRP
jgi:ribA/ribD-fused uncharacterized protein